MTALSARQNEPTMDEILSSIRKIISDDLGASGQTTASVAPDTLSQPEVSADILELSSQMALPNTRETAWNIPLGRRDRPAFAESARQAPPAPKTDPVAAVAELTARMARAAGNVDTAFVAPLPMSAEPIADSTEEAVSFSFGSLRKTIERESSADSAVANAMKTVVESALRPMLKDWLDANLPTMVERLVKAEIERMAKKV